MQLMLEWKTIRGVQRMGTPDVETAKQDTKELIRNGETSAASVYDLDTPFPYTRVAGWQKPAKKET